MDVLLHTDIFFYKFFQLDIHPKRDCPLKKTWELFFIQSAQIHIIKLTAETLIARSAVECLFTKGTLQIFSYFHSRKTSLFSPVSIRKQTASVPEKQAVDLICCCLHVKYNAHALFLMGSRLFQLDYDRTGKILISQILGLIIFTDVYHSAQILDQGTVGIICCRFIKKSTSVRVSIEYNLNCIDNR